MTNQYYIIATKSRNWQAYQSSNTVSHLANIIDSMFDVAAFSLNLRICFNMFLLSMMLKLVELLTLHHLRCLTLVILDLKKYYSTICIL